MRGPHISGDPVTEAPVVSTHCHLPVLQRPYQAWEGRECWVPAHRATALSMLFLLSQRNWASLELKPADPAAWLPPHTALPGSPAPTLGLQGVRGCWNHCGWLGLWFWVEPTIAPCSSIHFYFCVKHNCILKWTSKNMNEKYSPWLEYFWWVCV